MINNFNAAITDTKHIEHEKQSRIIKECYTGYICNKGLETTMVDISIWPMLNIMDKYFCMCINKF